MCRCCRFRSSSLYGSLPSITQRHRAAPYRSSTTGNALVIPVGHPLIPRTGSVDCKQATFVDQPRAPGTPTRLQTSPAAGSSAGVLPIPTRAFGLPGHRRHSPAPNTSVRLGRNRGYRLRRSAAKGSGEMLLLGRRSRRRREVAAGGAGGGGASVMVGDRSGW